MAHMLLQTYGTYLLYLVPHYPFVQSLDQPFALFVPKSHPKEKIDKTLTTKKKKDTRSPRTQSILNFEPTKPLLSIRSN